MRDQATRVDKPRHFRTPIEFRSWLTKHHAFAHELWVGFHRKSSGKSSITWPESVKEALCFGWIDGIRKRIDDASYKIRFSPRRPTSIWSAVNIRLAKALIADGRMTDAGSIAFRRRKEFRSGIYSYEQRPQELPEPYASALAKNKAASKFFQAQPPGYRKLMTWWIVSAKQEATRRKRLAKLIAEAARGRRL